LPNDDDSTVQGNGTNAGGAANENDSPAESSDADADDVDAGLHESKLTLSFEVVKIDLPPRTAI
jgi:hypothetical protein